MSGESNGGTKRPLTGEEEEEQEDKKLLAENAAKLDLVMQIRRTERRRRPGGKSVWIRGKAWREPGEEECAEKRQGGSSTHTGGNGCLYAEARRTIWSLQTHWRHKSRQGKWEGIFRMHWIDWRKTGSRFWRGSSKGFRDYLGMSGLFLINYDCRLL